MPGAISLNAPNKVGNTYATNRRVSFTPLAPLKWEAVKVVYGFDYNMTFENRGVHRSHRRGGTYCRKSRAFFEDTFQGKTAECALYNVLCKRYRITHPSFDLWKLWQWDTS